MQTAVAPDPGLPTRFIGFLDEIKVCPAFLQRLAGYALTGSTKEERMSLFYGGSANGKSKFVEQIQGIMDDYSRKAAISTIVDEVHSRQEVERSRDQRPNRQVHNISAPYAAGLLRIQTTAYADNFGSTQPSLSSVDSAIRSRMV